MKRTKDSKLTGHMSGFTVEPTDYTKYEISFRRWLISQIDSGKMSMVEARERFKLNPSHYTTIIKRWQEKYSDELHVSLQSMSSKERADNKALEKRIKELEKQLELSQMKNVALNTMIDIAEQDYKLEIRKKSGPNQ